MAALGLIARDRRTSCVGRKRPAALSTREQKARLPVPPTCFPVLQYHTAPLSLPGLERLLAQRPAKRLFQPAGKRRGFSPPNDRPVLPVGRSCAPGRPGSVRKDPRVVPQLRLRLGAGALGRIPNHEAYGCRVVGVAGVVELRAIRDEHEDVHRRTHLDVASGRGDSIRER
jgi:hypothetical protein